MASHPPPSSDESASDESGSVDEYRQRLLGQWRDVYEESLVGLRSFLRHRLKQEADVDDCLQAVYVKIAGHVQSTTQKSNPQKSNPQDSNPQDSTTEASNPWADQIPAGARKAWLFRVAANEAALVWRRASTTDRALKKQATVTPELQVDDTTHRLIEDETVQQIRQIIDRLPETTQQIIRLRIDEDLTFGQIAQRLEIPLGTALTRMRRALEKIKIELDHHSP